MNNTRQFLKIKVNYSIEDVNKILNNYLEHNSFIQTNYNDERVLKLNNLFAKQSFYDTYIKIYLINNELTIIGWINYKNTEYGFDDKLDLEDFSFHGNWKPTQQLYDIFFAIVNGFKSNDDNIICEKRLKEEIVVPQEENLFVTNIKFAENKNNSKIITVITFLIIFGISFLIIWLS